MTARRAVLRVLGLAALIAGGSRASGQQPTKTARVGALWFASSSDAFPRRNFALFRQRLRELGYVEGKTIVIDERFAEGSAQRALDDLRFQPTGLRRMRFPVGEGRSPQ